MSVRLYNVDPADGIMTFIIPPTGTPPPPQTWTIGAEVCPDGTSEMASSLREELAMLPVTPNSAEGLNVGLRLSHIFSGPSIAPFDCWSQQLASNVAIQDQWFDNGNMDGTATATEQVTYPNSPTISLTILIRGSNPPAADLSAALGTDLMRALCWIESRWRQFGSDGMPIKNVNANGSIDWGCVQINNGTHRQAWQWTSNVAAGLAVLATKQNAALGYLNAHPPVTDDMILNETIQRYNGGTYYAWDDEDQTWEEDPPSGYVASVRDVMTKKPWQSAVQAEALYGAMRTRESLRVIARGYSSGSDSG